MFDISVRERDLDHFLLEELNASPSFLRWFLNRLSPGFVTPAFTLVRVQRSPRRLTDIRQTDLQIAFFDGGGELRGAVLIENKVTSGFQHGQPESYAAEVAALRRTLSEAHATAVLVAPRNNFSVQGNDCFQRTIFVEEITDHLLCRVRQQGLHKELRARLEVKIELLETLSGKRANSRWTPESIPERRDFRMMYEALVHELTPNLKVRQSVDGKKATTRFFDFPGQRALPYPAQLKHEFGHGDVTKYAALQFKRAAHLVDLVRAADGMIPEDGSILVDRSGTSLMIRVVTPGINPDPDKFEEQRENLVAGIEGLMTLYAWLGKNQQKLASLMVQSG